MIASTFYLDNGGTLHACLDGTEMPELASDMAGVLSTVTPSARPNFLKLSARWIDAWRHSGRNPGDLFANGPTHFRAALARWHKNESGRFAWDWAGGRAYVYLDDQEDEDVTEAFNAVLRSHFESSRRKYFPFLVSYANFELDEGEDPHAFLTESSERVRHRVKEWARRELDLVVDVLNRQPDSSVDVRSETGSINHRALGFSAIRQLMSVLKNDIHLRTGANPLDIDDLDTMGYYDKLALARSKYGKVERLPRDFGAQFSIKGRRTYAPIPHDPLHTYALLSSAAAEQPNFPPVLLDKLAIMNAEGPRHHDIRIACMDAWAASGFGDWMYGGNKASADPEYKKIMLGPEVAVGMAARVDAAHLASKDPPATTDELIKQVLAGRRPRPSMDQLHELKARGRVDVLKLIPMFPANHGGPYSYSGWYKWNRKAIDEANGGEGAWLLTSTGVVRPAPHWLRRSMFTERLRAAASKTDDPAELKILIQQIRDDAGHRSEAAIWRYVQSVLPDVFDKPHAERSAESRARMAASRANMPAPPVRPVMATPTLSEKSTRLRGRARP